MEYKYEVAIPYFMNFSITSKTKLTKSELLQKCHEEGDGTIGSYDDDNAEINSGELKED